MGGVSLELLAAGKNLIVSERGGLAECAGDAALTFPNGDFHALHRCMVRLLTDPALAQRQLEIAQRQVEKFDELALTRRYVELYRQVLRARSRSELPSILATAEQK